MGEAIGRALTVLAGCACYAAAFLWCTGPGKEAAYTVLTNGGAFMIGTLVSGAGQISVSVAQKLRGSDPPQKP
jgi:hypothetical protein